MTPRRVRHEPVWWAADDRFATGYTWPVAAMVAALVLAWLLAPV